MDNITVIIPVKLRNANELKWFDICIQSVPKDTPIVIVNDHSYCDWAAVKQVISLKGKIKVKQLIDRTGLAAARNLAMKEVNTEFFFPLDADDYLELGALETAMGKYPGDGFVYGATRLFNDKQSSIYKARPYDICKLLEAVYWPNGCLQKTENWKAVEGWDETLAIYEDWDYWLRSFRLGIIGHPIDDLLYHYRQNPNGIILTLKKNADMTSKARGIIENKHKDLFTGENPMCSGCGNKNKPQKAKKNTTTVVPTSPETLAMIHEKVSAGMVLLIYTGKNMTRSYYGRVSGTLYRFGKGKNKYGYVAEDDIAYFLSLREGNTRIFTLQEETK